MIFPFLGEGGSSQPSRYFIVGFAYPTGWTNPLSQCEIFTCFVWTTFSTRALGPISCPLFAYAWRYSRFPCLRAFEAAISLARTLQCIASCETDVVHFREKSRAMASRSLESRRFCEQTLSWKQAALFLLWSIPALTPGLFPQNLQALLAEK